MPIKLKNLYPGKLPLPQLDVGTYDPQTIHYHKIQDNKSVDVAFDAQDGFSALINRFTRHHVLMTLQRPPQPK